MLIHNKDWSAVASTKLSMTGGGRRQQRVKRYTEGLLHFVPVKFKLGDMEVGHYAHNWDNGGGAWQIDRIGLAPNLNALSRQTNFFLCFSQRAIHKAGVTFVSFAAWKRYLQAVPTQVPGAAGV